MGEPYEKILWFESFFSELGLSMKVVTFNGANLALEALINKEVHLAISQVRAMVKANL